MVCDCDSNRGAPPAPSTSTIHRAQRTWHCAQACGADCPTPNRACCNHQCPPQHATATTIWGSQCHPPQPPSTRLQCPGITHKRTTSIARDDKLTTVMMAHCDDDSHARHMQGAPVAPSPPPHQQAHSPGTAPENRCQPRKAHALCTTMTADSTMMEGDDGGRSSGATVARQCSDGAQQCRVWQDGKRGSSADDNDNDTWDATTTMMACDDARGHSERAQHDNDGALRNDDGTRQR